MPLVRAMRLINALEAGTLNAAGLQSLLAADPSRANELSVMLAMRGQVRRVLSSPGAWAALVGGGASITDVLLRSSMVAQELADYPDAAGQLADAASTTTAGVAQLVANEATFLALLRRTARMSVVDATPAMRALVYGGALGGGYLGCIHTVGSDRYAVVQAPKAVGEIAAVQWKISNDASAGTSSDDFGLANADAQNNVQHPLFQWARGLTIGGFADWAPPAYNVIRALAARVRPAVADNALFKAGGAQVYEASPVYWSATQHPSTTSTAWYVDFSSGSASSSYKTSSYRARVVRMIKL